MREERLIRALVRDLQPARSVLRVEQQLALFLLWSAAVVTVFVARSGAAADGPPWLPVLVTASMVVAAGVGAVTSSFPGRASWRPAAGAVVAAVLVWVADIMSRTQTMSPAAAWGSVSWVKCLVFTTGVAMIASAGLWYLLRRGWPVRPRLTGALALTAGASAGALTTTLECVSNAPLHVLVGHLLPIVLLASLGALGATRVVWPGFGPVRDGTGTLM